MEGPGHKKEDSPKSCPHGVVLQGASTHEKPLLDLGKTYKVNAEEVPLVGVPRGLHFLHALIIIQKEDGFSTVLLGGVSAGEQWTFHSLEPTYH